MHPRQASLVAQATTVTARLSKQVKQAAAPVLWKYTDPDGQTFYLDEKKTTIRSPFTGKSFPARPERHTPAQLGKEIKEDAAAESAAEKTASEAFVNPFIDE